jgi:hypothetical protein
MAVSKDTLIYSYVFTFAVLLAVMTNACQYFARHSPRKDTWWGRNGPLVLLAAATFFLLVAPFKNLVVNICMQSFRQNGFDSTIEWALDFAYMPIFKYEKVYTGIAYALMCWATVMQIDLLNKFQAEVVKQESRISLKSASVDSGSATDHPAKFQSASSCGPGG